jgi:hypothetical protein
MEPTKQVGIDELKKVVAVLASAANVADQMVNEKGGVVARLTHLMGLSTSLIGLAGCSATELKAEFADLDAGEKADLVQYAKDQFAIAEHDVEAKIEAGLDLAIEGEAFIVKVVAFSKSLKAPAPAAPAGA